VTTSIAIHVAVVGCIAWRLAASSPIAMRSAPPSAVVDPPPIEIAMLDPTPPSPAPGHGGSASSPAGMHARASAAMTRPLAMSDVTVTPGERNEGDIGGHGRGGTGHGGDGGDGGDGFGGIAPQPTPPAVPAAPPVSRARAARLIYPTHFADVDDSALFVARITVDEQGFVVGAHVIRGPNDQGGASGGVWRFRYEPALDDAGHPIRTTLDQEFGVR